MMGWHSNGPLTLQSDALTTQLEANNQTKRYYTLDRVQQNIIFGYNKLLDRVSDVAD